MDYAVSILVGVVIIGLSIAVGAVVIPWLKNKGLVWILDILVAAAEKLAENQPIDKKAWVLAQLAAMGVKITPFVEACLEAAVQHLDIAMQQIKGEKGGGRLAE